MIYSCKHIRNREMPSLGTLSFKAVEAEDVFPATVAAVEITASLCAFCAGAIRGALLRDAIEVKGSSKLTRTEEINEYVAKHPRAAIVETSIQGCFFVTVDGSVINDTQWSASLDDNPHYNRDAESIIARIAVALAKPPSGNVNEALREAMSSVIARSEARPGGYPYDPELAKIQIDTQEENKT